MQNGWLPTAWAGAAANSAIPPVISKPRTTLDMESSFRTDGLTVDGLGPTKPSQCNFVATGSPRVRSSGGFFSTSPSRVAYVQSPFGFQIEQVTRNSLRGILTTGTTFPGDPFGPLDTLEQK